MRTEEEFNERARQLLRASAEAVPGRVRSRLTQARQAALAEVTGPRLRAARFLPGFYPALGALTAALLVALIIGNRPPRPPVHTPPVAVERPTVEDLDLLADSDGLDLMQSDDASFYEWALLQVDGNTSAQSSGNGV